jgi:hypothetical protein
MGGEKMGRIVGNIKKRWAAETPLLYKRIRNVMAALAAMAVAAQTAVTAAGIVIGETWTKIFAYTIGISAAVAALSQLTKSKDDGNDKKDTKSA